MLWKLTIATVLATVGATSVAIGGVVELRGPAGNAALAARGLSATGRYAVGRVEVDGVQRAARWDVSAGSVLTLPVPPGAFSAEALTVSADGSVIHGVCYISGVLNVFRWEAGAGGQGAVTHTFAAGVSFDQYGGESLFAARDGSIVFGNFDNTSGAVPFRWTPAEGVQLIVPPLTISSVRIDGVNSDGSVIVGSCYDNVASNYRGFRMHNTVFTLLTWGTRDCRASGVSANGQVVVGAAQVERGLVWNAASPATPLAISPPGPNDFRLELEATSGDGTAAIGSIEITDHADPAWWSAATGPRRLNDHLASIGVNLTGAPLTWAWTISEDANVILAIAQGVPVVVTIPSCSTSDYNGDSEFGTDQDIEAFFACLAGNCCPLCWRGGADFNGDGDAGTDADIEAFFRVLAGNGCDA